MHMVSADIFMKTMNLNIFLNVTEEKLKKAEQRNPTASVVCIKM